MRIAAITRFKHADMYEAMKKLGWSYKELCKRSGVGCATIGQVILLLRRPTTKTNMKIHQAFLEEGIYLDILESWPEEFKGTQKSLTVVQFKEVESHTLCDTQNEIIEYNQDFLQKENLEIVLKKLNYREVKLLELMYLRDNKSASEVADILKVSSTRANQIHLEALRKLRHPNTIKLLK